jgi:hypothetical protein
MIMDSLIKMVSFLYFNVLHLIRNLHARLDNIQEISIKEEVNTANSEFINTLKKIKVS